MLSNKAIFRGLVDQFVPLHLHTHPPRDKQKRTPNSPTKRFIYSEDEEKNPFSLGWGPCKEECFVYHQEVSPNSNIGTKDDFCQELTLELTF